MRHVPAIILAGLFASAPVAAQDNAPPLTEEELVSLVQQMEEESRPAAEMVNMVAEEGERTVADATALVVGAGQQPITRSWGTLYGMCLAKEKNELAQTVGQAALAAAGEDDQEVQTTVSNFTFDQCRRFLPYLRPGYSDPRPPEPDSPSR